jgi:hypothetical protein
MWCVILSEFILREYNGEYGFWNYVEAWYH